MKTGYLRLHVFSLGRKVIEYQINTEWLLFILCAAFFLPGSFCENESVGLFGLQVTSDQTYGLKQTNKKEF